MKKVSKRKEIYLGKLIKKIDNCEVVSFDIFDTLIKRNCLKPHDIFKIVELVYNENNNDKVQNFSNLRKLAEKKARESSLNEDIDLDEIYKNFSDCYNKATSKKLKQIEIETELKFCVKNELMYEVYKYCKKTNKRIICVSDMYLSKATIKEILCSNGYEISEIYVSSDIGKLKRTGNLFKYVFKELKVKKSKILHIGDSKKSDFLIPKLLGIKSYLIPTFVNNCKYVNFNNIYDLNIGILYSFINNNVVNYDDVYQRIGYELLGPIAYSFCLWFHDLAKKNNINKLFFCARDMKFMQEIYNCIFNEKAIENYYLYISRKSIKLPYLYKNDKFKDFCSIITDKKMLLSEILENNNLKIKNLDKVVSNYSLSLEEEYNHDSLINNKNFKKFYDKEIKPILTIQSKIQYDNFMSYLNSMNFDKKSAIVDLGWKGTIQYSLMKIFNDYNLKGFYMGVEKRAYKELNSENSFGFLFNQLSTDDFEEKIYSFRSLFEMFFSALHGSTVSYSNDSKKYFILAPAENKNNEIIDKVQCGAIKFVSDFAPYYNYVESVNVKELMYSFIEIGINPTLEQTRVFGDLNFDNMVCGKLAKPQMLSKYIFSPNMLKRDLFRSEWKVGFLKRLLKMRLPYFKIYNYLRKKKNR